MSGLLHDEGPAAPPRDNGELVFGAPWESTAFGMAVALEEAGVFTHEEFRRRLIGAIAAWEARDGHDRGEWRYYALWLEALESLLLDRGLVAEPELQAEVAALARHDHHDHDHSV